MDVTIVTVHESSCFVSVPHDFLELVYEGEFESPLILELTKGKGKARHYAVWGGATAGFSHLEVPNALAECMGIADGDQLKVRACAQVPYATSVEVEPATEDDWEILELNQGYLEEQILNQVGVVKEGVVFPVWLHGKDKLLLRVVKASPAPLVRLMAGIELIVAPKERTKKQTADKVLASGEEEPSGVWLRVQEVSPDTSASIGLGSARFTSLPTTEAFISPTTAKEAQFCDGQVAVVAAASPPKPVEKNENKGSSTRTGLENGMHGLQSDQREDGAPPGVQRKLAEGESAGSDDGPQKLAVVRVRLLQSVARGHVMLSRPLRQQLGARLMTRVFLRPTSAGPSTEPVQITIHPLVLSPEQSRPSGDQRGDSEHDGSLGRPSWQTPIGRNQSTPQGGTSLAFHRHLLSQVLPSSNGRSASSESSLGSLEGSRSAAMGKSSLQPSNGKAATATSSGLDRILNEWVRGTHARAGKAPAETGRLVADGTLMHLALLDPSPDRQSNGDETHLLSPAISKAVSNSRGKRERKWEEALFVIRLSFDGRLKGGRPHAGEAPQFVSLLPQEGAELARSKVGKTLVWEAVEKAETGSEEATLEGMGWLAGPAKDALGGLRAVLSVKAKRLLRTLGTPSPGSVLIHGPQASGKTRLVHAIAKHLREDPSCLANSVYVPCTELAGEQAGVATARLRSAIEEAVECAPSLVVLDDIDVLLPAADQEGGAPGSAILGQAPLVEYLADVMDTCQVAASATAHLPSWRSRFSSVAFLGVARSPSSLAKQLCASGRFDLHVELPAPAEAERADILAGFVSSRHLQCLPGVISTAAARCTGFDVSDLDILVERALHAAAVRHLGASSASLAAATVSPTPATSAPAQQSAATSAPAQRSAPGVDNVAAVRMMAPGRLELTEVDFATALQGFVPVAMRGIGTKTSSADGPQRGWDDVGGLEEARRALQEVLELPAKHAKLFSSAPLRLRSGVLLYGPPGCGKTHLVGAAASACGLRFISVKGPELLNKYIGASEQAVRDVFARAAAASPCMLFFDEFDAIAPKRGHDNTGVTDRVVNQLLTELDGVEALTGVFVIAATSRPDLIDAALLRPGRLDQLLMCDFPALDERRQILWALARQLQMGEDADLARIAAFTDGFSGADLQALLSDAQLAAVHEVLDASSTTEGSAAKAVGEPTVLIRAAHLDSALRAARPSVPESERSRLRSIYDQFHASRTASTASVSQQAKGKRATLA